MKIHKYISALVIFSILLSGCSVLSSAGVKVITPSDKIISEYRDVSGYQAIDFSTFGKVNVITGDKESLNISGPDNLVPEITTTVSNGTLFIKNKENFTVANLGSKDILTFTIVVKALTSLSVSGAGDIQVETLTTPSMTLAMSGAGNVLMNQLNTTTFKVDISGLGGLEVTGSAAQATFSISGAGNVNAKDMKLNTANITISGLGGATLWVTDSLTGEISGAGNVSYYGSPQKNTNTSGLGTFKGLGSK